MPQDAADTGMGSTGTAAAELPAAVLGGAAAISGSGICMSSWEAS